MKRFFGVLFLAMAVPAAAQTRQSITLDITGSEAMDADHTTYTLASGAKVVVANTDIHHAAADATASAVDVDRRAEAAAGGSTNAPPLLPLRNISTPTDERVTTQITRRCERESQTDFRMQAYCRTQQREAAVAMSRRSMTTPDQITIRMTCLKQWGEDQQLGFDYRMLNYCEEQQLKALTSLGR